MFELISANADWANIHTYVPQSNYGSDLGADLDADLDADSNSLDLDSAADSDSNPEPVMDLTAAVGPEHNVEGSYNYLDFGNTFEPVTPRPHAFGIGELFVVNLVPGFVPTMISRHQISRLPNLQPLDHPTLVCIHIFSLKY